MLRITSSQSCFKVVMFIFLFLLLFAVVSCAPTSSTVGVSSEESVLDVNTEITNTSHPDTDSLKEFVFSERAPRYQSAAEDGPADGTRDVYIRVNWILILNDSGDVLGSDEFRFATLVIRDTGASAQLLYPGTGAKLVQRGDKLFADGFALTVNEVSDLESVQVFFVGIDEDSDSAGILPESIDDSGIGDIALTTLAINAISEGFSAAVLFGVAGMEGLAATAGPVTAGLGFAVGLIPGFVYDYWTQVDVLGEFGLELKADNDWQMRTNYAYTLENENLQINFTIIDAQDRYQPEQAPPEQAPNACTVDQDQCQPFIDMALAEASQDSESNANDDTNESGVTPTSTTVITVTEVITVYVESASESETVTIDVEDTVSVPECAITIHPELNLAFWRGGGYASGCPSTNMMAHQAKYQLFENGLMLFVPAIDGQADTVFAISPDGNWEAYPPSWIANNDPGSDIPAGLFIPDVPFYDVWFADGGAQSNLGWALHPIHDSAALMQRIDNGGTIVSIEGADYYLASNRRWFRSDSELVCPID